MRISQSQVWISLVFGGFAGLFGTWCMDQVGAYFRKRGIISGPPPLLVAKWFAYLRRGRTRHADIVASPEVPVSFTKLVVIHYAIGVVLGVAYAGLHLDALIVFSLPTELLIALTYGICTSVFAWFVLFPGMGYGAFGTRAPACHKLFRTSLINHAVYGLGVGTFWLVACTAYR